MQDTPDTGEAEAVAAGCALLGTVEGADDTALKERLRALLRAAGSPDDTLAEAARSFDGHARHIRDDATAGEADAMGVLRKVRGDADAAKRTVNTCLAATGGPGALSPAQAAMARRLCESLNLSPTQFGF